MLSIVPPNYFRIMAYWSGSRSLRSTLSLALTSSEVDIVESLGSEEPRSIEPMSRQESKESLLALIRAECLIPLTYRFC